jgi:hypothetical protein
MAKKAKKVDAKASPKNAKKESKPKVEVEKVTEEKVDGKKVETKTVVSKKTAKKETEEKKPQTKTLLTVSHRPRKLVEITQVVDVSIPAGEYKEVHLADGTTYRLTEEELSLLSVEK